MMEFKFIAVVGEQDGKKVYPASNSQDEWKDRPKLRFATLDAAVNACGFTAKVLETYMPQVVLFSVKETCRTGIVMMPEQLEPGSEAILMNKDGKLYQKGKGFATKSYLKAEHFTSREEVKKAMQGVRPMTTEIVILEYKPKDVLCTSKLG